MKKFMNRFYSGRFYHQNSKRKRSYRKDLEKRIGELFLIKFMNSQNISLSILNGGRKPGDLCFYILLFLKEFPFNLFN